MATVRMAGGSVLSAISSTANSVITAVDSVNDSLSMIHNYVRYKKEEQELTYLLDRDDMKERALFASARKEAELKVEIEDMCKDKTFSNFFNESLNRKRQIISNK